MHFPFSSRSANAPVPAGAAVSTATPGWWGTSAQGRFVLMAGALWLLWVLGYEGWLRPDGRLDAALSYNLAAVSAALLRALGFATTVDPAQLRLLRMDGQPGVIVGDPCDGLVLYALLAGFVLAYPGGGWRRLPFVALGCAVLYGLNVVRIAALALNHHYYHQSVAFNHHYTFTCLVYGVLLLLWLRWTRLVADAGEAPTFSVA